MKVKKQFFTLLGHLFLLNCAFSQEAAIYLKLKDTSAKDASQYVFNLRIKNISYKLFWVQDTTLIKDLVEHPSSSMLFPIMQKKKDGKYKSYERFKYRPGVSASASILDSCSNCVFLKMGESLSIDIPVLKCYNMEKRMYRLIMTLYTPLHSCDVCTIIPEIESKYFYFTVN